METPRSALPAAIYCRISSDPRDLALGVGRQEDDCRALAEAQGWPVVAVYVDNDISASTKSKKRRPQYDEMIRLARAGGIGAILAYSNSRLTRRPAEWIELIDLANTGRIRIKTVASGEHDLSTANGRAMALTVAAWDAREAEETAEKVGLAKAQAARDGKYRGGPRPYGFEADGVTVREDEAQVIREATTAILAGRTLAAVARELNERGLTTSRDSEWKYDRLRDVLIRPRNAGLLGQGRADRGEVEVAGTAEWPAIVSEETWRAVYALLIDPKRRKQQGNEPRWLGSGLYRCGRCGGPMRCTAIGGSESRRGGQRRYYYRCVTQNHLMTRQDMTDEHVRYTVAQMVRDPRVVAGMQPHDDDLTPDRLRRQVLVTRLENFEADYADGKVTGTQLRRATEAVTAELRDVDERLGAGVRRSTALPIADALDPGVAFLEAPLDVQRAVLQAVVRVEVVPSTTRGAAWSPERLRLSSVGGDR